MADHYKCRYGISGEDIRNLYERYRHQNLREGFGTFDQFVKFCSESGFKSGMFMRKRDTDKIHSPENTFFTEKFIPVNCAKEKVKKKRETNWICDGCSKKPCPASGSGCPAYRKAWVENWNKHIYFPKKAAPVVQDPNKKEYFRYEHPDLIREGICFISETWR